MPEGTNGRPPGYHANAGPPDGHSNRISCLATEQKARQTRKIREIADALIAARSATLSEHARSLGLGKSTAWTILQGNHKASGLSAKTINRILASRRTPRLVRAKILEYAQEKAAGLYGHGKTQILSFIQRLKPGTL